MAGAPVIPIPTACASTQRKAHRGFARHVVLATTAPLWAALQQVSRTVPITFATVIDPVGAGVVASLARPGGNATGFITFEYGISAKWLELLKEILPGVKRVAVLRGSLRSPASAGSLPRAPQRRHSGRGCSRST